MLTFLISACAPQSIAPSPPPQAVASTPVEAMPVNVSFQGQQAQPTAIPQEVIDAADAEYLLLTNVYERAAPSVVNIDVLLNTTAENASGSGFVLDETGHIVTNAHVVSAAESILVTFNDGFVAEAQVIGTDNYSDLAVIKVEVDAAHLHPVSFGNSDALKVGQRAIAIGNPFGLASSMTVGIISGLGRQLPSAELIDGTTIPGFNNPSIIQVDTDINPGNSGGPLLNSQGNVIGINTAISSDTGIFQGVGFAVPSKTVQRVVPELIEKGRVDYSWIGISSISAEDGYGVAGLAQTLNLPVSAGVLISTITPGSPADEAGLQGGTREVLVRGRDVCVGGDIIVAVNDLYIKNMDELVAYLVTNTRPGDSVDLLVVRGEESFEVPLTLKARPNEAVDTGACGS
jgi:2-alkenal reductase